MRIKMGDPYFKIKDFCKRANIKVYSSNYQLYGDISLRIMNIFTEMAPEVEIYSIDEAFLKYSSSSDLVAIAYNLRKMVKRWVGIPISLGIAPTKTLSKVANYLAKKNKTPVLDLSSEDFRKKIFMTCPVGEVWGIGSRLNERLRGMGIHTVADFIASDPLYIRKHMGVIGERMLLELMGICCLDLDEVESKKSITCSRSFGKVLTTESEIGEALSTFVARASVKLRQQNSFAKGVYVFLETTTSGGAEFERFQFNAHAVFPVPTYDTSEIITAAKKCLKRIYKLGQRYKKCGVIFTDLVSEEHLVPDLFLRPVNPKRQAFMHTLDEINREFGKNKLFFGAMGVDPHWKMQRNFHSCHNTTSWEHLPLVHA